MTGDVFPDRSMDKMEKIAWMVEENGWAVEPVPAAPDAEPPRPGYTYTIGFETAYGHPEVVVFGLTPVASRGLLGLCAEHLAAGGELPVGAEFVGLLDSGLRCALLPVDVDAHAELFETAAVFFGGAPFRMLQFAWPDRNGFLPWEAGFERRLTRAQPVLGTTP